MQEINKISKTDIKKMNYNELISIVKETNRPPGGISSILEIVQNTFLNKNSRVLEIGTSTGFTSLELARLTGCNITAIDINEISINECKERAKKLGLKNIDFQICDAESLNFPDEYYDMVFCGNVTSIVNDRKKAFSEYARVLKNGGYLIAIPMYYVKEPPTKLIKEVSEAIRVNIVMHDKEYWINFFRDENFELIKDVDYLFDSISDTRIDEYISNILKRPHLNELVPEARNELNKKYGEYIRLFRDNLAHMGYTISILRKTNFKFDEELFTGRRK